MPPPLIQTVESFAARHGLLEGASQVVVGVSGGVDSMTCVHVLRRMGVEVTVVHVNYGMREAADADARFVEAWCHEQEPPLPVQIVEADAKAQAEAAGESVQAVARRMRYEAFAKTASDLRDSRGESGSGTDVRVAVGHHRDDQAETLLLNLLRGSGPDGLAGMPPSRPLDAAPEVRLIRPLLAVRRSAIRAYAEEHDLPWRVDATNATTDYRRGVVRTKILPLLEQHFDGATDTLARTADLMRDYVRETLRPALDDRFEAAYRELGGGGALDLDVLQREPRVWQQRLILEAMQRALPEAPQTQAVAEEVAALIGAQTGKHVDFGGGRVWRERECLRFVPESAVPAPPSPAPLRPGTAVEIPAGRLTTERLSRSELESRSGDLRARLRKDAPTTVYADAARIQGALRVRAWEDGDRFRPLGMQGTKLVSDLLTDAAVPPHRRRGQCVVEDEAGIVWLVGHRLAHRVGVRGDTEHLLQLAVVGERGTGDDPVSAS